MEVWRQKAITLLIMAAIIYSDNLSIKLLRVDSEENQLDMSPNAVDDQFLGCREKMLQKVSGKQGLIEEEQMASSIFSKAWNNAECLKSIPNGKMEHSKALELYTKESKFRQAFDSAVQSQGGNATAYRGFQFKALHFLLTDALQILRPKSCATVYHESKHMFRASVGDKVRFGTFISAISEEQALENDLPTTEMGTVFNITSCAAVNVEIHACYPEEFELLIPPFEEFRVLHVKDIGDHRIIFLKHTRLYSNHDCLFFLSSGSSNDPANSSMLLLLAASLCLYYYCLGHMPL